MRVLWFADTRPPAVSGLPAMGGGWVQGLRRALEAYYPDVEVAIASPGKADAGPVTAGTTTYYTIPRVRTPGRAAQTLARWGHDPVPAGAVAACVEVAHAFAPDIVHFHGAEHYFGLAAPRLTAPSIVSLQGMATVCELFAFSGLRPKELLREAATRQFVSGYGPIHAYLLLRERAAVERRILASCDDFMGRTEWDRTVLKLLRPGARYHEVGEVMAEPFYDARWAGPEAAGQTLYCTAGMSALKGVETLLEALALLRRSGIRNPRLRLGGNAVDGLLARPIRKLLERPELRGVVDVLGGLTPAQVAAELSRASAFVLPSHMDNSPNTLCEAMLVGVPCVAAHVGGVPSLVADGVDGLLYHDADPYALAGKVDRLLGDPLLARRLGDAARDRALLRHDPQRVAAQAVGVYREVLNRSRRTGTRRDTDPGEVAS